MKAIDVKEIHGYDAEYGLRVFRPEVLDRLVAEAAKAEPTEEVYR
jgi:hypothetical protein